jgi:hypothetical protein
MNILGHASVQSTTIYTMMHGKELESRARLFLTPEQREKVGAKSKPPYPQFQT